MDVINAGANDFISKPFKIDEIEANTEARAEKAEGEAVVDVKDIPLSE